MVLRVTSSHPVGDLNFLRCVDVQVFGRDMGDVRGRYSRSSSPLVCLGPKVKITWNLFLDRSVKLLMLIGQEFLISEVIR